MSSASQRAELRRALQTWTNVAPLTFTERDGDTSADFQVLFGAGTHTDFEDDDAFDGEGGVLAHAFYPYSGNNEDVTDGDAHFDEDETWTIDSFDGTKAQKRRQLAL